TPGTLFFALRAPDRPPATLPFLLLRTGRPPSRSGDGLLLRGPGGSRGHPRLELLDLRVELLHPLGQGADLLTGRDAQAVQGRSDRLVELGGPVLDRVPDLGLGLVDLDLGVVHLLLEVDLAFALD